MNRYSVLVLALVFTYDANAFQSFTRQIDGATITAQRSASQPCGVDLDIKLTNADQRMVIIDYTYSGTFEPRTFSGVYEGSLLPPTYSPGNKSGVINASMGPMSYLGLSHLTFADPKGLHCNRAWSFNFIATSYNASQSQRDHQNELRRKEQARIDEINRRRAAEEERKRNAQQRRLDYLAAQEKANRDSLANYKRSSPENARCIINERADIALCEQWKAREREQRLKLEAEAIQAQRQLEAEKIAADRQAAQFKEADALYERTRADPCAAAAENARRMSQLQQQAQQNNWPPRQLADAQAQWKQAQAAHDANCAATKQQTQGVSPQAPTAQPQAEPELTREQQQAQILLDLAKQLGLFK